MIVRHKTKSRGFTLVEMLVVAPVVILAIGAFLTVIISMTGEVLASRASNSLAYDVQDALNRIEQDVKLSTTFLAENNFDLNNGQGFNNDTTKFTNATGTSGTSIVLGMLATTGNPLSAGSGLVYLTDSPNSCASAQLKDNTPMVINVVYFLKPDPNNNNTSTLWRRTIMPTNYAAGTSVSCATPWQQPSCLLLANGTYSDAFCKTGDVKLVSGISTSGFSVNYFTTAASTIPNSVASSDPTTSARSAALLSTPTVEVSLTAQQSVAGRTIERSASLRASRLDTNATAIATPTTPTTPAAPTVSASTSAPTNVTFTWPNVSGATSYTYSYRINSGSWSSDTVIAATATRSFTVTNATHLNVVEARVTATNAAGTSGYGTNSTTVPLWTPMTLENNWVLYSPPFTAPAYTKTSTGLVVLKGMVKSGSGTIATLPAGYRVGTNEYLLFENSSNQTMGRVDITTSGAINLSVGSNAWFSLDGIAFYPSGTTFTAPTAFANGWQNYSPGSGDPNWAQAGYYVDSLGRVTTRGLVRSGTTTDGTQMMTLPAAVMPPEYMHVVNVNTNAAGMVGFNPANNSILAKGGSNGYVGINTTYYPTGRPTGSTCTTQWCNLTMQNGWVHYGSPYATPQYTKSADNMVFLKGLIRSGSAATMASLPSAYCPKEQLLLTVVISGGWGRVDISAGTSGGCSVVGSAYSNVWTSFDNIHYIADYPL